MFPKSASGCQKTRSWRDGSSLGKHISFSLHFQLPGWLTEASNKNFSFILMTCIFMFVFFSPTAHSATVSGNSYGSQQSPIYPNICADGLAWWLAGFSSLEEEIFLCIFTKLHLVQEYGVVWCFLFFVFC